ncbi:MAG: FGGY-family carbohydrate kinase [Gammaproteobacteria bacterium]|nr:FGGY-family carbohydrate kinase [Gammaproteobacteria bacterium]
MLGPLLGSIAESTGVGAVPVIAPAGHDTGSAVAAVPAEGGDHAYLSSGTWSLMGIESPTPLITEQTLALNFTNEAGVDGTIRFLKNIMGLWLVQQVRASLVRAGDDQDYAAPDRCRGGRPGLWADCRSGPRRVPQPRRYADRDPAKSASRPASPHRSPPAPWCGAAWKAWR